MTPFIPDLYAAAALLTLLQTQVRWHRVLAESLTGTFIAVSGRLGSFSAKWPAFGLVLLGVVAFAAVRRVSSQLKTGPMRWFVATVTLAPSVILAWAFAGYDFEFLFAHLLLACFAALLGNLTDLHDPTRRIRDWERFSPIKQETLLRFEADKYWRGLSILWAAAAAGIAALGTYVISGPPGVWSDILPSENLHALMEARVWIALALLAAFAPGIIWIVGAVVVRVNRIHRALADLEIP